MREMPPRLLTLRRGQVLSTGRGVTLHDAMPRPRPDLRQVVGVLVPIFALPMFAQCFQYMTDIPPCTCCPRCGRS